MKIRKSKAAVIACLVVTMIATTAAPAFAKAPAKEKTEYEGKGRVEVDFHGHVKYKKPKVTVKDTSGRKYSASIVKKDSDDLTFVIKKYKQGKTYKYTIKSLKQKGTKKYGKVKGTVKIPAAKAAPKNITTANANSIAVADAVKVYKIIQSTVSKLTCKQDGKKYEVEFIAEKTDGNLYEFEYEISLTGSVIERDQEYKGPARTSISETQAVNVDLNDAVSRYPKINTANIFFKGGGLDNGVWEVEIKESIPGNNYQYYDYEYKINASTGAVISAHKELED